MPWLHSLGLVLAALAGAASADGNWYDGLDGVKVFRPGDAHLQKVLDQVYADQQHNQFNKSRVALIFTRGDYKDARVPAGFYTSVVGVGHDPSEVRLAQVASVNGDVGGATQNFWRSVEGVTMTDAACVWAVSQGSPLRRSAVEGNLYLSDNGGWSSGGFMADVRIGGVLDMGTQQQWFFRNIDLSQKGVECPIGWNYVFVGVNGMNASKCQGEVPGKVAEVVDTPRIAEKPYLVEELDGKTWSIYVPAVAVSSPGRPLRGAAPAAAAALARKLELGAEVFVARPGMTPAEMEQGMRGKGGLLLTPGIYDLEVPIAIKTDGFVVLGLGFPTLVAHGGSSAIEVSSGVSDVRIAGVLLEAGTPGDAGGAPPLLVFGHRPKGAPVAPKGHIVPRRLAHGSDRVSGVISDLFARVGSFAYQGCPQVSVESMLEINADDVIVDNAWLWQADHDDCSNTTVGSPVASDACYSKHSMVVNGDRVTVYGLSAEHTVGGDVVAWNGEDGETYFYQCELPYHNEKFSQKGYSGYAVDASVTRHTALGLGVYIIGEMNVSTAYVGNAGLDMQNLVTVVIGKDVKQFANSACTTPVDGSDTHCIGPAWCDQIRCVLPSLDGSKALNFVPSTPGTVDTQPPAVDESALRRFVLSVKTSSQLMADCHTGATFSFFVNGKWTKAVPLFETALSQQEVQATVKLPDWPTKLRLAAAGPDSWGIKRVLLTRDDGDMRTILDSPDGSLCGDNVYWIDGSAVTSKAAQEYHVPRTPSRWRIFNHYDVLNDKDVVLMDGSDVAAVQHRVELGGYAGFTLSMGQAWLKPLGSTPFTKLDLQQVDTTNPAAFYLYQASQPHQQPVPSAGPAPPAGPPPPSTTVPAAPPQASRTPPVQFLPARQTGKLADVGGHARLLVTVLRATNLMGADCSDVNPFCVVVLSDGQAKEKKQYQTQLLHNTRNPEWNQVLEIDDFAPGDAVEFVIMNRNPWSSKLLGTAALTPEQIFPDGFDAPLPVRLAGSQKHSADGQPSLIVKVEVLQAGPRGISAAVLERDALEDGGVLSQGMVLWRSAGALVLITVVVGLGLAATLVAVTSRWRGRHWRSARWSRQASFEPLAMLE